MKPPHTLQVTPQIEIAHSIAQIQADDWNSLAGQHPLLSHAFLNALHESGSASAATGWSPNYLLLRDQENLIAAMPLYLKDHSYGEYVFDWAWAEAYQRNSLEYYPKLLAAIPFSPVSANKILTRDDEHAASNRQILLNAALQIAQESGVSSFHCLFPNTAEAAYLQARGLMLRSGVQFHWLNAGYVSFAEFLASMSRDKRKRIQQERRKVRDAGVTFRRLTGAEITEKDWDFFYQCYVNTYHQHRSSPYLNRDFFARIGSSMSEQILLVIAEQEGAPIAAALNFFAGDTLYGRYWGSTKFVSGLHFETCYYQTIEFCIEQKITVFEGGAQGEHKLARGFLPVPTYSAHWLAHPEFATAVARYLERETKGVDNYLSELNERQPFKRAPPIVLSRD